MGNSASKGAETLHREFFRTLVLLQSLTTFIAANPVTRSLNISKPAAAVISRTYSVPVGTTGIMQPAS